jgi:uncharacterized membrane protein
MIISGSINAIVGHLFPGPSNSPSFIGFLINFIVNVFVGIGFVSLALHAHDNIEQATFSDLWRPQFFLNYLGTTILILLVCIVGFVLLIIPGIIAALTFYFSNYLVVDRSMTPIAAMKESARITKGNRLNLFGLLLLLILLNLLGAICLLVGLLVTIPITTLAVVHAYRTLSGNADAVAVV